MLHKSQPNRGTKGKATTHPHSLTTKGSMMACCIHHPYMGSILNVNKNQFLILNKAIRCSRRLSSSSKLNICLTIIQFFSHYGWSSYTAIPGLVINRLLQLLQLSFYCCLYCRHHTRPPHFQTSRLQISSCADGSSKKLQKISLWLILDPRNHLLKYS